MKTRIQKLLVGAALVGAATLVQAQFTYTDHGNGTCAIAGYTGPGGAVSIPNSINGLSDFLKIICRFCREISPWLMKGEHSRQRKRKFNHGQDLPRMRLLGLEANKQSTNSGAA